MKNLLRLYISYMKLVGIGMVLAAIGFTFYAEYKTKDEVFFQIAGGVLAALAAFYVIIVILALKRPGFSRGIQEPPARPPATGSPQEQLADRVIQPVPSTLSRALVAALVLVCNAMALITYAKSRGWPIRITIYSFGAVLATIVLLVFIRSRLSHSAGPALVNSILLAGFVSIALCL